MRSKIENLKKHLKSSKKGLQINLKKTSYKKGKLDDVDSECKFLLKDCEKDLKNLNILSEAILNQGDKIDKSIDHMLLTA
jgi:small nuclear ribonucleoprotein (snRNP)-like protein